MRSDCHVNQLGSLLSWSGPSVDNPRVEGLKPGLLLGLDFRKLHKNIEMIGFCFTNATITSLNAFVFHLHLNSIQFSVKLKKKTPKYSHLRSSDQRILT